MVLSLLTGLAARSAAPVFPVIGRGARGAVSRLRLDPRIKLVDSPRRAAVLLVAGGLGEQLIEAIRRLHDQLPHPRATLRWPIGADDDRQLGEMPGERITTADPRDVIGATWAALARGELASEPDLGEDIDPAPWRGIGPYGQGGKGMTGGVPYGRPLAGRAPDRDGLELDQLPLRLGPLLPVLPPGLELSVLLQGDIVQEATLGPNPYETSEPAAPGAVDAGPVGIAELELARARHHLRWVAEALRVAGRPALGLRALALAEAEPDPGASAVAALARRIERDLGLRLSNTGVGVIDAERAAGLGPVARAAGADIDARMHDPAYRALDFRPVVHAGGDVRTRWRQRMGEALQALDLAARADGATVAGDVVEWPRGPQPLGGRTPAARLLELVPGAIVGQEWGVAVAIISSLDLDLEEAALAPVARA